MIIPDNLPFNLKHPPRPTHDNRKQQRHAIYNQLIIIIVDAAHQRIIPCQTSALNLLNYQR